LASSVLIVATIVLLTLQLIVYSRNRANFPAGLVVGDVPVGNLSRQAAAERLLEVYSQPVELHYEDQVIRMHPNQVDFSLNLETMIAAADLERTGGSFWRGFWNYLWGNLANVDEVPLTATYSEQALSAYLENEVGGRYDNPPTPSQPVPGSTRFSGGQPGTTINLEQALPRMESALFSASNRTVELPIQLAEPPRPNLANLQVQLQQIMDVAGYDGLAVVYFQDLETGQEIHFAYELGENLDVEPDISFTAASVIKIPILVSTYKRLTGPPEEALDNLIEEMIIQSFNDPADDLMEIVIDPTQAPLMLTQDLRDVGLENTFLAGHFYLGAPLLARFETPAGARTDVDTDPDPYNQTTASDMGMLLADIYQCAETGGGALVAVYGDLLTQLECQAIVEVLTQNLLGVLLEGGPPEGTQIAHKHGWVTNPNTGVINSMGDAGIIFTPSGDYVVSIFLYHPVQLIWEPVSTMFSDLSQAIYNYYTLIED
jgi:hypothetical protein